MIQDSYYFLPYFHPGALNHFYSSYTHIEMTG